MQSEKATPEDKLAFFQSGIDDFRSKSKTLHARLKAPRGRYRLVVVDTFEDPFEADTVIGDFKSLEEAQDVKGKFVQRNPPTEGVIPVRYYIYDEDGKFVE